MKQGKWICFPDDYQIMLANKVNTRRYQRDFPISPFWRMDSVWQNVKFYKEFTLKSDATLFFSYEGRISVYFYDIDIYCYDFNGIINLKKGFYKMEVWVYNPVGLPCLKIDGNEIITDGEFLVGNNNIQLLPASEIECGDLTPNTYCLPKRKKEYVSCRKTENGDVYDFGCIFWGIVSFSNCENKPFKCYFGETIKETMSDDHCEQICFFTPINGFYKDCNSKGFRYLRVVSLSDYNLEMFEEYNPQFSPFSFVSENKTLENIIKVAERTFDVCKREFFLDGAKRDRWTWSGDAYIAYKIDEFKYCDFNAVKNNIIALLGKAPVVTYINHVMDYTLYTIISVNEYYERSGDINFLKSIYNILKEHMDFVISRLNSDGFLYKIKDDWVFVDWNSDLNTDGEVCFEQILLYIALDCFSKVSNILGFDCNQYFERKERLKLKINEVFWNEKEGVYMHSRIDGKVGETVTAYANVFAILYNFIDKRKYESIKYNLLNNKKIPELTTPYMQGFYLSCLFELGEYKFASKKVEDYWGGMLKAGATTFWECYKQGDEEEETTSMYGRPFGLSHCHIWGANALYLIPRYYFGIIENINSGEFFIVKPIVSLINNSKITVPLKRGILSVSLENGEMEVFSSMIDGKLIVNDTEYSVSKGVKLNVRV